MSPTLGRGITNAWYFAEGLAKNVNRSDIWRMQLQRVTKLERTMQTIFVMFDYLQRVSKTPSSPTPPFE